MVKTYDKPVVVSPWFEILPDNLSLAQRIEQCGRICYKSEDRITSESSIGFCRAMVKHKHNSVLEMGVLTHQVKAPWSAYVQLLEAQPKFLVIDQVADEEFIITGSVRAFREMFMRYPHYGITNAIVGDMWQRHTHFFEDLVGPTSGIPCDVDVRKLSLAEVDNLSPELQARHRFVAVRFVVNRAVTHEIVRHRPCAFLQESQRYCRYSEGKFGSRVTFIKPMFFEEDSGAYKLWEKAMLETEKIYFALLAEKGEDGKDKNSPQAARTVLPNSCKTEIIVYASLEQWHHIFHMRAINPAAEPSMREIMVPAHEEFQRRFPKQNFGTPRRMSEGWVS